MAETIATVSGTNAAKLIVNVKNTLRKNQKRHNVNNANFNSNSAITVAKRIKINIERNDVFFSSCGRSTPRGNAFSTAYARSTSNKTQIIPPTNPIRQD